MAVFNTPRIEINGSLNTSNGCLSNIDLIARNSQTFIAWDPSIGKWVFTVNKPESIVGIRTFDDSNIVGSINVSGSGIDSIYNAVRTNFNHQSLEGQTDQYYAEVSSGVLYDNEATNELTIDLSLINNPAQAAFLSNLEMKQSRLDQVINFSTDYSESDVQAGELISVTNSIYGYSEKTFRVIEATEAETDDGAIVVDIVALEYDADVYDETGLEWPERNKITNITPIKGNICVQEDISSNNDDNVEDSLIRLLGTNLAVNFLNNLLNDYLSGALGGDVISGGGGDDQVIGDPEADAENCGLAGIYLGTANAANYTLPPEPDPTCLDPGGDFVVNSESTTSQPAGSVDLDYFIKE